MKFKTLNGQVVGVDLKKKKIDRSRSESQAHLGVLLTSIYGEQNIFEEFNIPGEKLYLDYFIPKYNLAFEFQGIQHDKFNSFFHQDRQAFLRQQARDRRKRAWCDLNRIVLIEIRDNQITLENLKKQIIASQHMET